ncbi:MAG: MarR family winged helix-turn-helix transcriptional regulator [Acidobacteriota bacterium]
MPPTPCLCATLRKASRSITSLYDAHLKPAGLKVTQYSMLMTIARNPSVAISSLADILVMDQTTVTRNLQLLKKKGYVRMDPSPDDQRMKCVTLTATGQAKLEAAKPLWEQAQHAVTARLGELGFDVLLRSLTSVIA